jgi:hypothetical protein
MEELPHGKTAVRSDLQLPHGNFARSRTAILQHQEYKDFQEDVLEEESANAQPDFENLKKPDDRFDRLKEVYIAEFERKCPNLKAPFDGSDGKMLSSLLKRQPEASFEDLAGWIRNAFASEVTYPLQSNFRLREFCSHAEKYSKGPLKRAGTPSRAAAVDERQAAQIERLVL